MITQEKLLGICKDKIVPSWNSTPNTFPSFLREYTKKEQEVNGAAFKKLRPTFANALPSLLRKNSKRYAQLLREELKTFVETECLFYLRDNVPPSSLNNFEEKFLFFIEKTKSFDGRIGSAELWQALRNYLIYCVIQLMEGRALDTRDTIFAFSLLYPYTDNFIDSCRRTKKEKENFNNLVRMTILEKDIKPKNRSEKKTKSLLQTALDEYEGCAKKKEQTKSLLMDMQDAQENSMNQKSEKKKTLTYEQILELSVNKGCYSVVIDYLFAMDLETDKITDNELEFYLAFGLMLQLVDDIQDISEDMGKSQTLMTLAKNEKELEDATNKLFHFTHTYMTRYLSKNQKIQDFFVPLAELAVLSAIMRSSKYYSKEYLQGLKKHFPA